MACSFDAFFRNATKKEAAGAARGGCQVGELGLASAMALVGRGICYGRRNGHGHGSPALVDLEAAPRQSSSTSPSAHPLIRRSAPRQGRANAKGGAPANATALLRRTTTITTHGDGSAASGPAAARGRAARGPSGGRAGARARKAVGRRRSPTARMARSSSGEAARRRTRFDWKGLRQLGRRADRPPWRRLHRPADELCRRILAVAGAILLGTLLLQWPPPPPLFTQRRPPPLFARRRRKGDRGVGKDEELSRYRDIYHITVKSWWDEY